MQTLKNWLPGLLLVHLILVAAYLLAHLTVVQHLGLGPLTVAIILGAVFGNLLPGRTHTDTHAGVMLAQKQLLRWGVALYGLNLSLAQVIHVGPAALVIDILMVISTLLLGWWVGVRLLGMDEETAILTAAGSAICGAAAVVATESVLKAEQHKTAAAVGTVVLFGSLAMLIYPLIFHVWTINAGHFGIYAGSTVHEVAQVVAIGKTVGDQQMTNDAVIVKMIRVMLLAPFMVVLGALRRHRHPGGERQAALVPGFAVAFIVIALIHPYLGLPQKLVDILKGFDTYMLAAAMAALGLGSTLSKLRMAGKDALLLASILFAYLILGGGFINTMINRVFA